MARGLITGKAQAEEELDAFYKKVLPANVSAARSLTYVPVVEIARRNDVNYVNRVYEDPEELHPEDSRRLGVSLKRLTTRVVLQGDYESIRAFIYELEQAPQFVVIDQVTLLEAGRRGAGDAHGHAVDVLSGGRMQPERRRQIVLAVLGRRAGLRAVPRLAADGCTHDRHV